MEDSQAPEENGQLPNRRKMLNSEGQDGIPSWTGVVLATGAGFLMACTSLVVKLATSLPFYEMLMARCLGTLIFGPPLMIYYSHPFIPPSPKEFFFVASRGLFGCAAMAAMFFAFGKIPLGDATALVFTSPVWTAILGYFILGEGWTIYDSVAVVLSCVGITLITRPSFLFVSEDQFIPSTRPYSAWFAYAASIGASVALALSYICVRKVKKTGSFTLVFYYGVMGMILSVGVAICYEGFKLPDCGTVDNLYALLCAFFSFCGQVCVISALKLEKAAIVALGRATDIAFVFILQASFINTEISGLSIVGAVLVLSCNISIFFKKWFANKNSENN